MRRKVEKQTASNNGVVRKHYKPLAAFREFATIDW